MENITLTKENIDTEHICCAFSDKKCADGYMKKKCWLTKAFEQGWVFRRLDERAKVFIEYGPAEKAWIPIDAPNYLALGCFWVSGKYKQQGHGKALLREAVDDAKRQGKSGLVAVVGARKYHFMSDTKWFLRHGFEVCDTLPSGFLLVALSFGEVEVRPSFKLCAKVGLNDDSPQETKGCVVYYSNRCPFSEYHVNESLVESCKKRGLPLKIVRLETIEQAQSAPTPATIFSLFIDGEFITTDISVCIDTRFDKMLDKKR
ncbi:N-acetyltransferase [Photobacterium sp. SDRW27]|uniref:GNAT family N-acetyltransferase n=1 Tax=Photobacterium obscurum TaxID=2829490 RepID=UPI0022448BDB|nr:GNAT family N-acetyltransferase [Photobacterium obscurum]MCW8328737.1 N-acetyltransferase [Photobacterium obscurum]